MESERKGFLNWFKTKPTKEEEQTLAESGEPLIHQLLLSIRGSFDLDDILQQVAQGAGEQLQVDRCMVYLNDEEAGTLRWRAGYQAAGLDPARWTFRAADFPELFNRLRQGWTVKSSDKVISDEVMKSLHHAITPSLHHSSLLFIPAASDQLEAVILLSHSRNREWAAIEMKWLQAIAAEIAVAARTIRLGSTARQAERQLQSGTLELQRSNEALGQLVEVLLHSATDSTAAFNRFTEFLAERFQAGVCSIEELADKMVKVRSLHGFGRTTTVGMFAIERTPREQVIASGTVVVLTKAAQDFPQDRFLNEHSFSGYVGVPVVGRRQQVIGLLNLFHESAPVLSKQDLSLLSAIARRVAFELESELSEAVTAQMREAVRQQVEAIQSQATQLESLRQARERLRTADSLEEALQQVVELGARALSADFGAIALYKGHGDTGTRGHGDTGTVVVSPDRRVAASPSHFFTAGVDPRVRAAIGALPVGKGLLGIIAGREEPLRLDDLTKHPRFSGFPPNHPVMTSFLAVPLRARGQILGAIYFADKHGGQPFSGEDERFASDLAAQVAVALRNDEFRMQNDELKTTSLSVHHSSFIIHHSELIAFMESGATLPQVSAYVCEQVAKMFPGSLAAILTSDWRLWTSDLRLETEIKNQKSKIENYLFGFAIDEAAYPGAQSQVANRKSKIVNIRQDERAASVLGSLIEDQENINCAIILPLAQRDETLGVLLVFGSDPQVFEGEPGAWLEAVAYHLEMLMDQVYMEKVVARRTQELAVLSLLNQTSDLLRRKSEIRISKSETVSDLGFRASDFPAGAEVCQQIVESLAGALEASHCALWIADGGLPMADLNNTSLSNPPSEIRNPQFDLVGHYGLSETLADLVRRFSLEQAETFLPGMMTGHPTVIAAVDADPRITNPQLAEVLRAEGIRSGVIIPLQEKSEIRNTKSETNSNDQNPEVSDFDIRASNFPAGAEVFPLGLLILAAREEPGDFSQYFDGFFALLASLITNLLWPRVKGPQTTDHEPQTTDLLPSSVVHRPSSIVGLQEALVGHSSSGVVAVDRDGRITLFNPAMEQLIGYWQGEVLGSQVGGNYLTFLSGVNPFVATLQSGQEAGYGELALLQRDGGRKLVAAKIVPLKDENGATVGALGLFNDLTSMRALEQERHRLAPLALIGEMAARLAHEIKNPLASMMSGLELLQRRLSYGEQEGRYFQRVLSEMKRLDMTIREMLAFSRPAPLQFAPVGSCDPLERALEALEPQMEASHVRVIRSYAPDLQPVVMDENQMEQVFLNLLLNAMQAMPEGGTLRVSVRQVTRPDLEHELGAAPAFVEYIIQDSGVGIPESAISKIFDPFFSTKTHGTGLGLATVKKVIDGHQGHIRVQSQPGSGTMFTIYLPSSR